MIEQVREPDDSRGEFVECDSMCDSCATSYPHDGSLSLRTPS